MQDKFTKIYDKKIWGGGSGKGSTLFYNKNFIFFLEDFIKEKSIKSVIDLGCGDWEFSQYINWNCEYLGIDCVETVVESNIENYQTDSIKFEHGDIFSDRTILDKQCDLIILKDVLQHWDNLNIIDFIEISSTGNAVDFGNLTGTERSQSSFGSSTRMVTAGAQAPGDTQMEAIQFASLGNAVDFADSLSGTTENGRGTSDGKRGVFAKGGVQNVLLTKNIFNGGAAVDFGDLSVSRTAAHAASNGHGGLNFTS